MPAAVLFICAQLVHKVELKRMKVRQIVILLLARHCFSLSLTHMLWFLSDHAALLPNYPELVGLRIALTADTFILVHIFIRLAGL